MVHAMQMEDYTLYTLDMADMPEHGIAELPLFTAEAGDDGYFVVPYREVCFLTRFLKRADEEYTTPSLILPVAGMKIGGLAYLAVFDGMKHDARLRIRINNGRYLLSCVYDLDRISMYEAPSVRIYTLTGKDADYSGMARFYRALQLKTRRLIPLKERALYEPAVAYALDGMPVVRIRMGWKPVPSPVLEQTVETEPEMFVAATFQDVERLVDEMRRQGIEKAEIVLVGWNVGGHDGRWPQAFPVEEKLGGEAALMRLIQHVQRAGYRLVCHTNANDAYRIADCWQEENLIRTKQGALCFDSAGWGGGRMYDMCLIPSRPVHAAVLDRLQELGTQGFHYVDVLSIVAPRTCYHPDHPMTAEIYVKKAREILLDAKRCMGGVSSEGGMDFAADLLDFALYISFNLLDGAPALADEPVPLWQLVYHGYVLNNASAETVNCMVKAPQHRLKALEYGSIPTVYYYSRFVGGNRQNWMGDADMRFSTEEELKESVRLLKEYLDGYQPFVSRQFAIMENHTRLTEKVYCTTYSDGYRVVVNYGDSAYQSGKDCVPALSAVLLPPDNGEA